MLYDTVQVKHGLFDFGVTRVSTHKEIQNWKIKITANLFKHLQFENILRWKQESAETLKHLY